MKGTHFRVSSLAPAIDVEVVKSDISFLTFETPGNCSNNILFCYSCNMWSHLCPSSLFCGQQPPPCWLWWLGWNSPWLCATSSSCSSWPFGRFGILGGSRYRSLSPGFVHTMIFHHSLNLDFGCSDVGQSISSGDLLIGLLYVRTWP